jgi:hypothetical protein
MNVNIPDPGVKRRTGYPSRGDKYSRALESFYAGRTKRSIKLLEGELFRRPLNARAWRLLLLLTVPDTAILFFRVVLKKLRKSR